VRVAEYVAVIVTGVGLKVAVVVTANVADLDPAGTVTEVGTAATVLLLLDSVTTAPETGAGRVSVTVPVLLIAPPGIDDGRRLRVASSAPGAYTFMLAVCMAISVAVTVAEKSAVTFDTTTSNDAVVAPSATTTCAGTLTEVWELERATVAPPVWAGVSSVTVPPTVPLPVCDEGTRTEPIRGSRTSLFRRRILAEAPKFAH
jgi:hypothetical protein